MIEHKIENESRQMEHIRNKKDAYSHHGLARQRVEAARKMRKRSEMMRAHGQQCGLFDEKHRQKIDQSLGYMRDGNVTHYVSVGFRPKTKDRNRYGPARRLFRHDARMEDRARIMHDSEDAP